MLCEKIKKYNHELDLNCAETLLAAGNEEYNLGFQDDIYRLVSGFGGGFYSERICGALCGSIAVLSKLHVGTRAHNNDEFKVLVNDFIARFEAEFGTINCGELKQLHRKEETGCLPILERAANVLDAYLKEIEEKKNTENEVSE